MGVVGDRDKGANFTAANLGGVNFNAAVPADATLQIPSPRLG